MKLIRRKVEQKIVIDGKIVVTLIDTGRGKATIGVEAPKGVAIEIVERLERTYDHRDK